MKTTFEHDSQIFTVDLVPAGKAFRINVTDQTMEAQILEAKEGRLELLIDGQRVTAYVSSDHAKRWVTVNGRTLVLNKPAGGRKSGGGMHHASGELIAPMPGQIRAVNVKEGETVTKGQTLLLLEAMKMEIRVQAPRNGVVKKLSVVQGQTVERDQQLVEIEET